MRRTLLSKVGSRIGFVPEWYIQGRPHNRPPCLYMQIYMKGGEAMVKGAMEMARANGYGKPNMANLSGELGRAIIKQIINTPAPDMDKMLEEADAIEARIIAARKKDGNNKDRTL